MEMSHQWVRKFNEYRTSYIQVTRDCPKRLARFREDCILK